MIIKGLTKENNYQLFMVKTNIKRRLIKQSPFSIHILINHNPIIYYFHLQKYYNFFEKKTNKKHFLAYL